MPKDKRTRRVKLQVSGVKHVDTLKVEVPEKFLTKDEGSFTFGYCKSCDWRGPGRRARDKARKDTAAHSEVCEGKGKTTIATGELKHKK